MWEIILYNFPENPLQITEKSCILPATESLFRENSGGQYDRSQYI